MHRSWQRERWIRWGKSWHIYKIAREPVLVEWSKARRRVAGREADSGFIKQELIGHGKEFRFHSKCDEEGFRGF